MSKELIERLRRDKYDSLKNLAADRIEELERKVASRDAEVVSLTNQRDYEYVRAENAEQERDQFREQLAGYKQDAERYRFIRDNPWNGTELESVITCHLNAVWDLSIDEAIRARGEGK